MQNKSNDSAVLFNGFPIEPPCTVGRSNFRIQQQQYLRKILLSSCHFIHHTLGYNNNISGKQQLSCISLVSVFGPSTQSRGHLHHFVQHNMPTGPSKVPLNTFNVNQCQVSFYFEQSQEINRIISVRFSSNLSSTCWTKFQ